MKKSQKIKIDIEQLVEIENNAESLLTSKHYKKALEYYKILFNHTPKDQYKDAIRDCYIGRTKEFNVKSMYKEAVVLWENHRQYCTSCNHSYLYVNLLLFSGAEQKAASFFVKHQAEFSEEETLLIEELFAALILGGIKNLLEFFPDESLIKKHYEVSNQALISYCLKNFDQAKELLSEISFRSPYKQLRLLLQSCLKAADTNDILSALNNVQSNSPFYKLASIIKLSIFPSIDLAQSLPSLNSDEFNFLSLLKNWDLQKRKYLDRLRQLKSNNNSSVLLNLILNNLNYIDRSTARRLSYSLLSTSQYDCNNFDKYFEPLEPEEIARLKAKNNILAGYKPFVAWLDYEAILNNYKLQTHKIKLKRALAARYAYEWLKKDAEANNARVNHNTIGLLERSLALDPLDKATYLELIQHHNKYGSKKSHKAILTKALNVFSGDRDILILAIEEASKSSSINSAIKLTNNLLKLDSTNVLARKYMLRFQIAKAQDLILQKKYDKASSILQNITVANKDNPIIQINNILFEYIQNNLSQALVLVSKFDQHDLLIRLQFYLETVKLKIPFVIIERNLKLLPINKLKLKSFTQLSQIINIISEQDNARADIEVISEPLKSVVNLSLASEQLVALYEMLDRAQQFDLLLYLVKNHRHFNHIPIMVYYYINAKTKGNTKKIKQSEFIMLMEAFDKAEEIHDIKATILIDKLLEKIEAKNNFPFNKIEDFIGRFEQIMNLENRKF